MSILCVKGSIFSQTDVDAIVNTVNCVGVMGKGVALECKEKWPLNFKVYAKECRIGNVRIGEMLVYPTEPPNRPKYIINFPTKKHWRQPSQIEYIQLGLIDLVRQVQSLNIFTIAIPPLGCGNGGLNWDVVRPLIVAAFSTLPEVEVRLYDPTPIPQIDFLKLIENYYRLNDGIDPLNS